MISVSQESEVSDAYIRYAFQVTGASMWLTSVATERFLMAPPGMVAVDAIDYLQRKLDR